MRDTVCVAAAADVKMDPTFKRWWGEPPPDPRERPAIVPPTARGSKFSQNSSALEDKTLDRPAQRVSAFERFGVVRAVEVTKRRLLFYIVGRLKTENGDAGSMALSPPCLSHQSLATIMQNREVELS